MTQRIPLYTRLPAKIERSSPQADSVLLDQFLAFVQERGLGLYPAQEEAILQLLEGHNVILNTPTGSGKSLVALALHFFSLARGRRSVYTAPIKALVNEKFKDLCRELGADRVGLRTGDGAVNPDAPIICCTAEVLSNQALREGPTTPFEDIIMDEFHFYSDRERGVAWQVPLLTLTHSRFLLMSATLGETQFFEEQLKNRTGLETITVQGTDRPVPLEFSYENKFVHEILKESLEAGRAPVYIVNFTQREATERAQALLSVDFLTKEQKKEIAVELESESFRSPFGAEMKKMIRHGIGLHHAGLLPRYRLLVERLAQQGLLRVICGTDTLGVGVNIPIRTVVFSQLCKFDGQKTAILSVRDFHQISGRAGRKGFDDRGYVIALAPEHTVENLRQESKVSHDPKKARKLVKKKPPERGYVAWDAGTFERLRTSKPEALRSQFRITHGVVLNVLSRSGGEGCKALRQLIRDSHETAITKKSLRNEAWSLFCGLYERKIVDINPQLRVNIELQDDFSLHQTLSLYLLDTVQLLDRNDPEYGVNVITLCESVCEDPDIILRKQVDRLKTIRMAELKAEGVEFDERIEILETIEHPKPMREWIYQTFNDFARLHPWVGQDNIQPKSIVREMFETYQSFTDYIKEYDLERSEGLLLRYLSEVYKVLAQTVPNAAKDDVVLEIEFYLKQMIRAVDSSLVDEWERMAGRQTAASAASMHGEGGGTAILGGVSATGAGNAMGIAGAAGGSTAAGAKNSAQFQIEARDLIFRVIRVWLRGDYEALSELVQFENQLALESALKTYLADYGGIQTTTEARSKKRFQFDSEEGAIFARLRLFDLRGNEDSTLTLQFFPDGVQKPRLLGISIG
jgi:superfamily II RNA helicase